MFWIPRLLLSAALVFPAAGAAAGDEAEALARDRRIGESRLQARIEAGKSLARASDARKRIVLRKLGNPSPGPRYYAFDRIGLAPRAFTGLLTRSLESRNGYLVRYSTLALAEGQDPKAREGLTALFKDERTTEADAFYALGALASIGAPESAPLFRELLLGDGEERLRRAAEVGLMRAEGAKTLAWLASTRAALAKAEDPRTKDLDDRLRRLFRQENARFPASLDEVLAWAGGEPKVLPRSSPREVLGDGYRVVSDLPDDDQVRRIAMAMVENRQALQRWLAPGRRDEPVTLLRLFASRRDFEHYGATREFNFVYFSEFYYSNLLREIVAFGDGSHARFDRRIKHETCHDVLEYVAGTLPPWVSEGLCELAEVTPVVDGRLDRPPVNREWLRILAKALDAGTLPAIAALIDMSPGEFYGSDSQIHYAAAWSFCHFLVTRRGEKGLRLLRSVLEAVQSGGAGKAAEPLRGAFTPKALEGPWRAHVGALVGRR